MVTFTQKILANGYHVFKFTKMQMGLGTPSQRVNRILCLLDDSNQCDAIARAATEMFSTGGYHTKVGRFRDCLAVVRRSSGAAREAREKALILVLHKALFSTDANLPFSVIMRLFLNGVAKENKTFRPLNELRLLGLFYHRKYRAVVQVAPGLKSQFPDSTLIPLVEGLALHHIYGKAQAVPDEGKQRVKSLLPADLSFKAVPPVIAAEALHAVLWVYEDQELPALDITAFQLLRSRRSSVRRVMKNLVRQSPLFAANLIMNMRPHSRWAAFMVDCARELMKRWQLPDALVVANRAIAMLPANSSIYTIKASVLWDLGQVDEALACARCAVALEPFNHEADELVELLNGQADDLDIEKLKTSIRAAAIPVKAAAWGTIVLARRKRACEAEQLLKDMMAKDGLSGQQRGVLIRALGELYERAERFDEAAGCYKSLIWRRRYIAASHIGVARCMLELNRLDEATVSVRSALKAGFGDNKFDATIMNLRLAQGNLYEGLRDYRCRKFSVALRQQFGTKYIREGQKLSDFGSQAKLLLIMEHGPGDETRIASLYPELQKRFDNITATCEPRLFSLFERNFPKINFMPVARSRKEFRKNDYDEKSLVCSSQIARFINNDVVIAAKDADLVCSIYDLQCELRPNAQSFSKAAKIIDPLPELALHWRNYIGSRNGYSGRIRIAINWRSMLQNFARDRNYFQISEFAPLADLKNVEFWAFQPTMTEAEFEELQRVLPNVYCPEGLDLRDDFEGMAAFLANMDVTIAPMTSNAELSAAVGTPALILSNVRNTSWRRNPDGSDMWHHKARIVIGSPLGDRESQMASLLTEIKCIMDSSRQAA